MWFICFLPNFSVRILSLHLKTNKIYIVGSGQNISEQRAAILVQNVENIQLQDLKDPLK
jgi:hypothetical protein